MQNEKREIHTVFRRFPFFCLTKNLSLPALAYLFRASLMQEAGYELKPGKYISFRAEGQERFTRAKTIGENYTEERLRERIAGRNPRKQRMQTERKGISLIIDIQNSIKAQESKGYAHWAKIHNLQEAARTINYLTEN